MSLPAPARAPLARLCVPETLAVLARAKLVACVGREALCTLYRYELLVHVRGPIDPGVLLGEPLGIAIETQAGERFVHGHIGAVQALDAQRLRLTLRPFLALADLNRAYRIFQERDARGIVEEVLAAYPAIASLDWRARERLPRRRYCVQYGESDAHFVMRLLEEDGLGFHFEHRADAHTLVVSDPATLLDEVAGYATLAYRPTIEAVERAERIRSWHALVRPAATRVVLADYDFKRPSILGARAEDEATPAIEHFDFPGRFYDDPAAEGPAGEFDRLSEHRARVTLERLQTPARLVQGTSDARGLAVGHAFTLAEHPEATHNRRYRLLSTRLRLRQPVDETDRTAPAFACRFVAITDDRAYRPSLAHPRPRLPSLSARVSGPTPGLVHTDRFGRVKLAFHWDREKIEDAHRSCWVRVSQLWAGAGWGASFLPRVGDEVLVRFLESDPERPVVVARLANAERRPVEFSAAGALPANHALAGFRSRELGGSGANQLLFDDTPREIRTQLESTHGATQLNLGFLTHPREGAKAPARGEGFELRTDQWGALRAPKGLLLSAEGAKPIGGQLDRDALQGVLQAALALANALNEAERGVLPGSLGSTQEARDVLANVLKDWPAPKQYGHPDAPSDRGVIAIHGEAGVALASAQATTIAAETIDLASQANVQSASGQRTQISAGHAIALHAHGDGSRWVAGQGPLKLQAQADQLRLEAAKNLDITASDGGVRIEANGPLTLGVQGGGYIKLENGNVEIGGPQALLVKMGLAQWVGPARESSETDSTGDARLDHAFEAIYRGAAEQPVEGVRHTVRRDGQPIAQGASDDAGRTDRIAQTHYVPLDFQERGEEAP